MSQSIFESVQSQTQFALMSEADFEPEPMKAFSVRLPESYVNLLDKLAEAINVSRNSLISEIVCKGADEALSGYASVFEDPLATIKEMRSQAGFDAGWHKPEQAE